MNQALYDILTPQWSAFLDGLALLSAMDCGTANTAGVDPVGAYLRARIERISMCVEAYPYIEMGDSLVARRHGLGSARLLLFSHLDTVYPDS